VEKVHGKEGAKMRKFLIILSGVYWVGVALLMLFLIMLPVIVNPVMAAKKEVWIGLVYILLQIGWLLATGIGIILIKKWAKISLLALSGFSIFIGVSVIFLILFSSQGNKMRAEHPGMAGFFIGTAGLVFFAVLIPLFFLIFFNSRGVKEIFAAKNPPKAGVASSGWSLMPLGYKILAIFYGFSFIQIGLMLIFQAFPPVYQIGGIVLTGLAARFFHLAGLAVCLYITVGLIKKIKAAWIALVVYNVIMFFMMILNGMMLTEDIVKLMLPSEYVAAAPSLSSARLSMLMTLIIPVVTCIYAWLKRGVFLSLKGK
jgi:hypothetical protein